VTDMRKGFPFTLYDYIQPRSSRNQSLVSASYEKMDNMIPGANYYVRVNKGSKLEGSADNRPEGVWE